MKKRIVVAISGATGAIYGISLLEALKEISEVETHLVISHWGKRTIEMETSWEIKQVCQMADRCYDPDDQSAPIASGSFHAYGMVIIPCSMKTLSAVANGYSDNLIVRAADVMLKERRKLILVPRETPLNTVQLNNMLEVTRAGGIIAPPMPSFYHRPQTINDLVIQFTGRILDTLDISNTLTKRLGE